MSETYKISDHYDGSKFSNPNGVGLKSFWNLLKWKMTGETAKWPAHVANKNYPIRLLTSMEKLNVTFINHSTFLIQLPGLSILTDPVYSERASPFRFAGPKRSREPGIPFDVLPKIDVVVISHNHYDHLDLETLKRLDGKFHPLFLVPLGDEKLLLKEGLQHVKAMDWWETVKVKDTHFIFTPAQHWSARGLWDKNDSLWGGFMIAHPASKIYFAGDSGHGTHFVETRTRLGTPDLALLPIGGYMPRWFMSGAHMDPAEAVEAHLDLGATRSIAMHFGTFQLSDEGIDEPVHNLKSSLKNMNIPEEVFMILDQGQAVSY